jgi:iron complex outermembrane receptor protein
MKHAGNRRHGSAVRKPGRICFVLGLTTVALPLHAQVVAANGSAGADEIIVTATKRSESLQNVPISIQALTSKKLDEHQVTSFDDYAKLLPSVTFQTLGPGQSQIYFRGIVTGGTDNHFGPQPTSALYLDETPLTTIGGSVDLHIYDMQRVEALSGPQGTLFGSSSLSGTLRLITNQPDLHKFAAGLDVKGTTFAKGANSSGGSVDGFVNVPLSETMAIRASAFYERRGGYISNTPASRTYTLVNAAGNDVPFTINNTDINNPNVRHANYAKKDFNDVETYGGRAALKIDLSESWTVTPSIVYQNQKAHGTGLYDPKAGDLNVHDFAPDLNTDQWLQAALTVHGKVGNWDVNYTGGYFARTEDQTADYSYYTVAYNKPPFGSAAYETYPKGDGTKLDPTQTTHNHDNYSKQTHELRVSSPLGNPLRLTAGMFYQRQTDRGIEDYIIPGLASGTRPAAVRNCGDDVYCVKGYRVDRDYAAFIDASYDIVPSVTVSGGIRGYIYSNTILGFAGTAGSANKPNCVPTSDKNLPCVNFNYKASGEGEVHRINLKWKIDRDHLVYATYSTGYRPGGANRTQSTQGVLPYQTDTLTNYEVGIKSSWLDRKLILNLALFDEEWKNVQYGIPGANGTVSIYNVGNARTQGLEGDLNMVLGRLNLSGSATYLPTAKLTTNFCNIVNGVTDCLPADSDATGANGGVAALAGTRLPLQGKFKGNATARYAFDVGTIKAFLQGSINYQSGSNSYLRTSDAQALGPINGFTTADFSFGANMGRWNWEAYVQNATDTRGTLSINSFCAPKYCGSYARNYPTKPQEFGLKLGTRF